MGYDVRIEIDRINTGGTFTNHDIIRGVVRLSTPSSLSLTSIEVKLEGVSQTQLMIPTQRNDSHRRRVNNGNRNNENRKVVQDTHKVLFDTLIVFPPENIRQVSQAKNFTLTPGTYTYDFSFKIPLGTSCKKIAGTSNSRLFNENTFGVVINDSYLNGGHLRNFANGPLHDGGNWSQDYHIDAQLPPTLDMKGMAKIDYFVKVTCRRSSFLKINLRAHDPFIFLPSDINSPYGAYRDGQYCDNYGEKFFRKNLVFKNRLPEVVGEKMTSITKSLPRTPESKSSKFFSMFGSSSPVKTGYSESGITVNSVDVPFAFEMRMAHAPSLSPTNSAAFKLYLISDINPSNYTLSNYGKPDQSNGLGLVYLQSLRFELKSTTIISVLDMTGPRREIHQSRFEETLPLCNNTFSNIPLDLGKSRRQYSSSNSIGSNIFELEIPSTYWENLRLPRDITPNFRTCNIERVYGLSVVAGFSSDKISEVGSRRETRHKVQFVELFCPDIRVMSGLKLTNSSTSSAPGGNFGNFSDTMTGASSPYPPDIKLPLDNRQHEGNVSQTADTSDRAGLGNLDDIGLSLPSYDDAVRKSSY